MAATSMVVGLGAYARRAELLTDQTVKEVNKSEGSRERPNNRKHLEAPEVLRFSWSFLLLSVASVFRSRRSTIQMSYRLVIRKREA